MSALASLQREQPAPKKHAPLLCMDRRKRKHPRKYKQKPGREAIREIQFFQRTTHRLTPRRPFKALCSAILRDVTGDSPYGKRVLGTDGPPNRFARKAIDVLHEWYEDKAVRLFEDTNRITVHCKREGITVDDMKCARAARGEKNID